MIKRVIEISTASYLHIHRKQLVIEQKGEKVGTVPIEDLGMLIIANVANVLTQQLLADCAANNVVVILCNDKYIPGSILLPLSGHSLHALGLREQIAAKETIQKRLWQQIVQAKLGAQAALIGASGGNAVYLDRLVGQVKTGDPMNCEAQGARYYWQAMFGKGFRRNTELDGINALLNYGYTIVRACVARALVGAGLHPAIGLQHCNQYNDFALADDILEPLRPLVDNKVRELVSDLVQIQLDRDMRTELLGLTATTCEINGRPLPLMVALGEYTASLRACLRGEQKQLEIPVCRFSAVIAPCGLS